MYPNRGPDRSDPKSGTQLVRGSMSKGPRLLDRPWLPNRQEHSVCNSRSVKCPGPHCPSLPIGHEPKTAPPDPSVTPVVHSFEDPCTEAPGPCTAPGSQMGKNTAGRRALHRKADWACPNSQAATPTLPARETMVLEDRTPLRSGPPASAQQKWNFAPGTNESETSAR